MITNLNQAMVGLSGHKVEQPTTEQRILYFLGIYPGISPSMLQSALGTTKPGEWRPILEELIEKEVIERVYIAHLTPYGRNYTHCKLTLKRAF